MEIYSKGLGFKSQLCHFVCWTTSHWTRNLVSLSVKRQQEEVLYREFSSVQFSSVIHSCPTVCDPMNRSTPGLLVHHHMPEFTQTHAHQSLMPSSHLILCRPLLLLPPIPPSIRVFSNEATLCMRWPKMTLKWNYVFSQAAALNSSLSS